MDRKGELWAVVDQDLQICTYFIVLDSYQEFKDITSHKIFQTQNITKFEKHVSYEKDDTWENSKDLIKIN